MFATLERPLPILLKSRRPVVLCVDDDPAVLAAVRRTLRREHYEVYTTTSPAQGLALLSRLPVNLVISDLRMPEGSGLELLEAVHRRSPETAGLLMTAYPGDLSSAPAGMDAVREVIDKPWDPSELRLAIAKALSPGPPGGPEGFLEDFDAPDRRG